MAAVADRLHANEVAVDEGILHGLLAEQFPAWADLPVERVRTPGSDHVLYRLGDDLIARLPRQEGADAQVDKERIWLPRLAPSLPHPVPVPIVKGRPSAGYPFSWSVYGWLSGMNPSDGLDEPDLAIDLARFVVALQSIDAHDGPPAGAQNSGRGEPLARRDVGTRAAIGELHGVLDVESVTAAWEHALSASQWQGSPVWLHGDLTPENLLVQDSRLAAVIDFGCLGVGDPACDLMPAWSVLTGEARSVFREELAVDEATWARGRGWALSTALIVLPYYASTHPPRAANARYRIREVLADLAGSRR